MLHDKAPGPVGNPDAGLSLGVDSLIAGGGSLNPGGKLPGAIMLLVRTWGVVLSLQLQRALEENWFLDFFLR
jgi:hypothetical protein